MFIQLYWVFQMINFDRHSEILYTFGDFDYLFILALSPGVMMLALPSLCLYSDSLLTLTSQTEFIFIFIHSFISFIHSFIPSSQIQKYCCFSLSTMLPVKLRIGAVLKSNFKNKWSQPHNFSSDMHSTCGSHSSYLVWWVFSTFENHAHGNFGISCPW